jgi:hypothetical protein
MSGAQSKYKPDWRTYNIVMSNYARAGEVEKLEDAEIQPNLRSYEILMSGYGIGAFVKMNKCFSLILHHGHNSAVNTFHSHALPSQQWNIWRGG